MSSARPPPDPARATQRRAMLAVAAGGAALAGLGVAWWRQPIGVDASANSLAALWALKVARPDGGDFALQSLRGKPLLINFWATWCAPCVREMPEIDRFYREFGPRGWQVLGLAIDSAAPVNEFLARVKVGFPIGLAGMEGMDLLHGLGNAQGGLPFSLMIAADGRIAHRKIGETRFDELAGWAKQA